VSESPDEDRTTEYLQLIEFDAMRRRQRHHHQELAVASAARSQLEASTALFQAQAKEFGASEPDMQKAAEADMGDNINWHTKEEHHHYPPPATPAPTTPTSTLNKLLPWVLAGGLGAGAMGLYNHWTDITPGDVSGSLGASDVPPEE